MSKASFINDPSHWIKRACEMRQLALLAGDSGAKAAMLQVAHEYERLADRAEKRATGATEQHVAEPDDEISSSGVKDR
jgi:hypothetical protein